MSWLVKTPTDRDRRRAARLTLSAITQLEDAWKVGALRAGAPGTHAASHLWRTKRRRKGRG